MGGRPVRLTRSISNQEIEVVDSILLKRDLLDRRTLIASMIQLICAGNENLEIAQSLVSEFSLKNSDDPVGTTRTLVTRVIKDLNSGASVSDVIEKRGKAKIQLTKWTPEKVKQSLRHYHSNDPQNFTYTSIKQSDPKLISHIENGSNFSRSLAESGINPKIHLEDVDWGGEENSKRLLISMLNDIIRRCGISSINYNSMQSSQSAILGIEDDAHEGFDECKRFGCIRRVPGTSILKRTSEIFGSYKQGVCELLSLSEEAYEDLIERKPQEVPFEKYLDRLRSFIDESGDDWTIADFMRADRSAHHGLYNKKKNLKFLERVHGDVMVAAVLQINFEDSQESESAFLESVFDDLVRETKSRRVSNLQIRLEGYRFQALFLDMLVDARVGLVKNQDFIYERYIDRDACERLGHTPHCKVDFGFPDFIIDTKTSVTAGRRIANQTLRYLDHTNHLIRVTLRQRHRTEIVKSKQLTTMTVYEFIDQSDQYIGRSIPGDWIDKFKVYERESTARIQEALGDLEV